MRGSLVVANTTVWKKIKPSEHNCTPLPLRNSLCYYYQQAIWGTDWKQPICFVSHARCMRKTVTSLISSYFTALYSKSENLSTCHMQSESGMGVLGSACEAKTPHSDLELRSSNLHINFHKTTPTSSINFYLIALKFNFLQQNHFSESVCHLVG